MPIELPEIRLWEQNAQYGTAKIAITCFDAKSGSQLESSGNLVARSDNSRWNVFGLSVGDTGSVHQELAAATKPSQMPSIVPGKARELIAGRRGDELR